MKTYHVELMTFAANDYDGIGNIECPDCGELHAGPEAICTSCERAYSHTSECAAYLDESADCSCK